MVPKTKHNLMFFHQKTLMSKCLLVFGLIFLLVSCGPKIIPDDIAAGIDKSVSFQDLLKHPEKSIGKKVLLGGEIIETHVFDGRSEIEILQKPLDSRHSPRLTDESLGRFFISDTTFLDPVIYKSGRRVTVVGVAKGSKERQVGSAKRRYPLLEKEHLYLWSPHSRSSDRNPRISIGFGAIFHD